MSHTGVLDPELLRASGPSLRSRDAGLGSAARGANGATGSGAAGGGAVLQRAAALPQDLGAPPARDVSGAQQENVPPQLARPLPEALRLAAHELGGLGAE